MPRKPRIEIAGYYHVINRGVEQRVIFEEKEDYEKFENITDIKERNKKIVKAYKKGYSQHMIAKVLGVSQPAVSGVIRRSR
jgi:DNA-directed RNA polymerase specialized sigma subunit